MKLNKTCKYTLAYKKKKKCLKYTKCFTNGHYLQRNQDVSLKTTTATKI